MSHITVATSVVVM